MSVVYMYIYKDMYIYNVYNQSFYSKCSGIPNYCCQELETQELGLALVVLVEAQKPLPHHFLWANSICPKFLIF